MTAAWYNIADASQIETPALAVYPDRIEENTRRIIAIAGGTARLRPHVKTHKMTQVIRLQMAAGIDKFKCATVAEAEMVASCGAPDVLLGYPLLGPNVERMVRLIETFPQTRFSALADDAEAIRAISATMTAAGHSIEILLDIDNGMHRSGIEPGATAATLYQLLAELSGVAPGGFHVYDGHIKDRELEDRIASAEAAFAPVEQLRKRLLDEGLPVPRIVAGGTPTFPVHARHEDREVSPGTCVFWDVSYETKFPDLDFVNAALVLTRVISKPGPGRLCLDLGYKAVSPDNPDPRVRLLDVPDARMTVHSEEHLAVETALAADFNVGDVMYGIPYHICPTCALHREALVIVDGRVADRWPVAARDRRIRL